GPVAVGAALAWLPEVTVAEAVSRHLVVRLARALKGSALPRPGRRLPLFQPSALAALHGRLRPLLDREGAALLGRLRTTYPHTAVQDLDADTHAGQAQALEVVAGWSAEVWRALTRALPGVAGGPEAFAATRALVGQAIRDLQEVHQAARQREGRLAGQLRRAAEQAQAQ